MCLEPAGLSKSQLVNYWPFVKEIDREDGKSYFATTLSYLLMACTVTSRNSAATGTYRLQFEAGVIMPI